MSAGEAPVSDTKSIWFVRHAPVDLKCLYGQMDVAPNLSDSARFNWLSTFLPSDSIWISSDLSRCTLTAQRVSEAGSLGKELVATLEPLREQYFGLWQGLEYDQMQTQDPDLYNTFWEDFANNRPPQGESFGDVVLRVGQCLEQVLETYAASNIVCFCHSGTIRAALALLDGMTPRAALKFTIEPTSVTKIDYLAKADLSQARADFVNRIGAVD